MSDEIRDQLMMLRDLGFTHLDVPEQVPGVAGTDDDTDAGDVARSDGGPSFDEIDARVRACTLCRLAEGRTNTVFGTGNRNANLMFIGEAPGRDEDLAGEPFVGRAGKLLTDIIRAMKLSREAVYIANVIKCRPPGNRNPEGDELDACRQYIERQIDLVAPKVIVTLGRIAYQSLLRSQVPISSVRGAWQTFEGIPVMPTYHPAYLLRNPAAKKDVWVDMKKVMERLGIPIS